ncbi:uncharacterized protein [Haliotis cracherodii]|uniref:uncharacterized protein isoform X1 n=1 Tax=Haliotis cracherodii TaxID=6455 RepID=UPI0039EA53D5
MTTAASVNVTNNDVRTVQIGNGNTVLNFPDEIDLNLNMKINTKSDVVNVTPNITVLVADKKEETTSSVISDGEIEVRVTDVSDGGVEDEMSVDKTAASATWTETIFQTARNIFSMRTYFYGSVSGQSDDSVTILDRHRAPLEPGDVVLADTFVLYLGGGSILRREQDTGMVIKAKLDVDSEFEKWEFWNTRDYYDFYTPSERIARACSIIDCVFEGSDCDFVCWCYAGMMWEEAHCNGYALYCR